MFVRSHNRRRRIPHLALTLVLVAGACSVSAPSRRAATPVAKALPVGAPRARSGRTPTVPARSDLGPLDRVVLTSDGFDSYRSSEAGTSLEISAASANVGKNYRAIYVQRNGRSAVDEQVCATWTQDQGAITQEGLALRVRSGLGEPGQAITVTKNIWAGFPGEFNVHVWTGSSGQWQFHGLAGLNFFDALQRDQVMVPFPWRVCARVEQAVLSVKIWPASQPEPGWDDPVHVKRALVPADTVRPGRAGWYAGHLQSGDSIRYDEMERSIRP